MGCCVLRDARDLSVRESCVGAWGGSSHRYGCDHGDVDGVVLRGRLGPVAKDGRWASLSVAGDAGGRGRVVHGDVVGHLVCDKTEPIGPCGVRDAFPTDTITTLLCCTRDGKREEEKERAQEREREERGGVRDGSFLVNHARAFKYYPCLELLQEFLLRDPRDLDKRLIELSRELSWRYP